MHNDVFQIYEKNTWCGNLRTSVYFRNHGYPLF